MPPPQTALQVDHVSLYVYHSYLGHACQPEDQTNQRRDVQQGRMQGKEQHAYKGVALARRGRRGARAELVTCSGNQRGRVSSRNGHQPKTEYAIPLTDDVERVSVDAVDRGGLSAATARRRARSVLANVLFEQQQRSGAMVGLARETRL